ncbi:hypothetical protein [Arthrobacter sp. UM1]|uniref:hypothetical protein n=1 Tax=Arthrobacter sp. UM1 TaxID=2766776 RepID=UPI001CF62B98|nr:hypothetical protein [Arthrobacter sp. UM1]MCB4209010.1 hypothetical protein [Arthrobacter sp. UM1]
MKKAADVLPAAPAKPRNPEKCQEYTPNREKPSCVTWRKNVWDPYQEKLAKWNAQKKKADQAYAAYKADDAAWDKENPGCNKVVPRPATAPEKPRAVPENRTPQPTQPTRPVQPTQPTSPTRTRGQCTPWNKWNLFTDNFRSFGDPGNMGSHAAFHIAVKKNERPQGGCNEPVDNHTEVIRVEILRAKGGGRPGVRDITYDRANRELSSPVLVYEPDRNRIYNEGDVTWIWDVIVHPKEIFDTWGIHKYTNINFRGMSVDRGITNRIRVNGYVPEKWNTIIPRKTNTF